MKKSKNIFKKKWQEPKVLIFMPLKAMHKPPTTYILLCLITADPARNNSAKNEYFGKYFYGRIEHLSGIF